MDKPKVTRKPVVRELKIPLRDDELLAKADQLAHVLADVARLEGDKKSYISQNKASMDIAAGEASSLSKQIAEKAEWRKVECIEERDFVEKRRRVINPITGEIIEERTMTVEELQMEFGFEAVNAALKGIGAEAPVDGADAEAPESGDDEAVDEDPEGGVEPETDPTPEDGDEDGEEAPPVDPNQTDMF